MLPVSIVIIILFRNIYNIYSCLAHSSLYYLCKSSSNQDNMNASLDYDIIRKSKQIRELQSHSVSVLKVMFRGLFKST